jgi:uncharacterized protein (TIGR02391 family)
VSTTAFNPEWAIRRLNGFLEISESHVGTDGLRHTAHPSSEVRQDAQIVEQILDSVLPNWDRAERSMDRPWRPQRDAAQRAIAQLEQQEELDANLGESAPTLSAGSLHPWIWDSCRTLWSTGHYREAVGAAARTLNAKTQQKLGRRDMAEWKLLRNAFQSQPPVAGEPRLRLMPQEDSDTFRSLHEGTGALAQGAFQSLRNMVSHEESEEPEEHIALEQLAVFSVLARRVDDAEVVTA